MVTSGSSSGMSPAVPPLSVALYSGIALERDAVSRSFILKLELLDRLKGQGIPVETVAFTQVTDFNHPSIRVVPDLMALIRQPEFDTADIHVFEYAMCYELFNAIFLLDRPIMIIDHNTTPSRFAESPEAKVACDRADFERQNFSMASRIVTDSEFTRDGLLEMGMDSERLSVLHLPPNNSYVGRSEHSFDVHARDGMVRLLYVGRLVRAKGIHDLLAAVEGLWERGVTGFTLTLAGSLRFSDAETVTAIEEAVARHGNDGQFTYIVDAGDKDIAALFGEC